MADDSTKKETHAKAYNSVHELPCKKLEAQLIDLALGDCTGQKVLDLGGYGGKHGIRTLALGARSVDVVNLDAGMHENKDGTEAEREVMQFHVADYTDVAAMKGLGVLREASYDLVMGHWVFDVAGTVAAMEKIWEVIATYVKPGGRFVGARGADPRAEGSSSGIYGISSKDVQEDAQGNVKYTMIFHTTPEMSFPGTTVRESYSLSTSIPERLGFADVNVVPWKDAQLVKDDPSFWKFEPNCFVVTAKKA